MIRRRLVAVACLAAVLLSVAPALDAQIPGQPDTLRIEPVCDLGNVLVLSAAGQDLVADH